MKFLRRLRPMWEYLTFYIYLCITDTTGEIFYREKEERGKKDTRSNSSKEKKDYYFCIIILLKKLIKINNLITQQVFYLSHSGDHFSPDNEWLSCLLRSWERSEPRGRLSIEPHSSRRMRDVLWGRSMPESPSQQSRKSEPKSFLKYIWNKVLPPNLAHLTDVAVINTKEG